LRLTAAGRRAFSPLDTRARDEIVGMLQPLPVAEQRRILDAMRAIRASLGASDASTVVGFPYTLRSHRPGDMGWVVHRHGALYFAPDAGYKKITLWTQRDLTAARTIYKAAGFELVSEEEHRLFGISLTAETWELPLTPIPVGPH